MSAGPLIRDQRLAARMTQAELADRLGTSQSAIARLERPDSNPRVETVERALRETGRALALSTKPLTKGTDESLILGNLALTPEERLARFTASYRNMREFLAKVRPVG